LIPHSNIDRLAQCISLHWHKGKGHKVIAGGYTDGLVCFWNVGSKSTLLTTRNDELLPFLSFYAHQGPVTGVQIYPHSEPRYVVTGGITDKLLNFWDLEQKGEYLVSHSTKKAKITRVKWPLCWPGVVASFEEQNISTMVIPPRNFLSQSFILPQNSSTSDVSTSDWLNCVAHSTGAGEVTVIINSQMMFGLDSDKGLKERRALLTRTCISESVIKVAEDGSIKPEDPKDLYYANYGEASERGVVFCDTNLDSDKRWPINSESAQQADKMDSCCSANYPLTSANSVAWNSNMVNFSWIAVGYQCGMVRILRIKASTSDDILGHYIASGDVETNQVAS